MRKVIVVVAAGAVVAVMGATSPATASTAARSSTTDARAAATNLAVKAATASHQTYCVQFSSQCTDPEPNIAPAGGYVGHDEPSVEFRSNRPGTGYDMTYQLQLPKNPPVRPKQNGSGGTWDFELRATFWLGLTLCDSESAPEYTRVCQPDSDVNAKFSNPNPKSPAYIGRHPGNAFMELQFYEPGYVPQFEGFGCTATQWCANMTIDSLGLDQNAGIPNNADCLNNHFLVGEEPVNWAYVTRSGKSQAPADPLKISDSANPALALNPDPTKDLMMNSGDRLVVHLHDTAAGMRADISDTTTGQSGSMTASTANGFGQVIYAPKAKKCTSRPYAFHPEYSTAAPRGNTWSAHTYNAAYSDEIGHFELCAKSDPSTFACTKPGPDDATLDDDDINCLPGADSLVIHITSCIGAGDGDGDFDGESYQNRWPGTIANAATDARLHPTPVLFTSPTNGGRAFEDVRFEANLPSIERDVVPACDRTTGQNCTNPPAGAAFYPFFSSTSNGPGQCAWQEGGASIPGTINNFGGSSTTAFGGLLSTVYPEAGFTTVTLFENFNRDLGGNPCLPG
ncbi:MAG: hypothetical protein ACHQE5_08610 [Actinomycetes bacterium]